MKLDTLLSSILNLRLDVSDIGKKYFELSNDILINDYIASNDSFLQYAINITIPNSDESTFIPFFHIALGNEEQSIEGRSRLIEIRENRLINYNFSNLTEDLKCDIIKIKVDSEGCSSIIFPTNIESVVKENIESKLNKHDGFTYCLWADKNLYNKPSELFFEIVSIDSVSGNRPSSVVVISTEQLKIEKFINERKWKLLTVIDAVKSAYIRNQSKFVLQESLKSAVSAIMTRNMSHNLGSHYLHYTKSHLEQLANRGGNFGPDIRGAARVMGYMQGRMDYLATLVSMDRYPYGCVNFKSQIYDELTIDDFSKRHFETSSTSYDGLYPILDLLEDAQNELNSERLNEGYLNKLLYNIHDLVDEALRNKSHNRTTNFLLSNLILSENFTRPDILDDNISSKNDLKMINLQVLLDLEDMNNGNFTGVFTGSPVKKDDEETVKRKLSEVNVAIPGGVMSSHAFFNIVENFIRNSAKYLQADLNKNGNLTITIKIKEINGYYEFTLFDDKQNANKKQPDTNKSLLDDLLDKISNLRILDDNNALDKKDKGFKEMLFSALWLRSYIYQNITNNDLPQSYEEVLVKIQSADIAERFKLIKLYGFELLAVDDDGNVSQENNANLALRFSLPKFSPKTLMALSDNDLHINLSNLLHIYADVAIVDTKQYTDFVDKLNDKRIAEDKDTYEEDMIVPRLLKSENKLSNIEALEKVVYARFGKEFDSYEIVSGSSENEKLSTPLADNKKIYFQRHLSTQDNIERYKGYAYADSVSGGNYTITLFDIYERWAKDGRNKDSEDYHHILKIKESALTRITIVDERFFKKMKEQYMETELACKNIRVLNYNDSMSKETEIAKFLEGNEFNNHENHTHFLSIHLGIIEKIIKNVDLFKKIEKNTEKVRLLMKMIKEHFGPKVFISIHSGRGNFSAELEDSLDMYPFISMAALENAYENSKYLLAQLFYSTVYIGKGVANHEN